MVRFVLPEVLCWPGLWWDYQQSFSHMTLHVVLTVLYPSTSCSVQFERSWFICCHGSLTCIAAVVGVMVKFLCVLACMGFSTQLSLAFPLGSCRRDGVLPGDGLHLSRQPPQLASYRQHCSGWRPAHHLHRGCADCLQAQVPRKWLDPQASADADGQPGVQGGTGVQRRYDGERRYDMGEDSHSVRRQGSSHKALSQNITKKWELWGWLRPGSNLTLPIFPESFIPPPCLTYTG